MYRLLVGSVYSGTATNEDNVRWYNLQLQMLHASAPMQHVEHAVSLSQGQSPKPFDRSHIVFSGETKQEASSKSHATHLHYLLEYFKQRRNDFDFFLFLDSDAFPYRTKWLPKLAGLMGKHTMAGVVRPEDMVWFPHPCACLLRPAGLDDVDWMPVFAEAGIDGKGLYDPGVAMRDRPFYPLVRSNRLNVHPLLCGIYGRTFYHHGAASRTSRGYRSAKLYEIKDLTDKWRKALFDDPQQFLKKLDW
jgi:hypothetical protein